MGWREWPLHIKLLASGVQDRINYQRWVKEAEWEIVEKSDFIQVRWYFKIIRFMEDLHLFTTGNYTIADLPYTHEEFVAYGTHLHLEADKRCFVSYLPPCIGCGFRFLTFTSLSGGTFLSAPICFQCEKEALGDKPRKIRRRGAIHDDSHCLLGETLAVNGIRPHNGYRNDVWNLAS